ncbi:MAG: carbamoyltransferase HypF [Candidatus Micrarchaeota archaeon]|nr:carbamoyltransferase HypF [Candidatus Micrarchaeota archaeon]
MIGVWMKEIIKRWGQPFSVAYEIEVRGVVQGVGFRPFIYRLAKAMKVNGDVRNVGYGVRIRLDCGEKEMKKFVEKMKKELPPLARIDKIETKKTKIIFSPKDGNFRIVPSLATGEFPEVSPDVCICKNCLREMLDPKDRRYLHPFINCTDCGPRLTVILATPYDRENTTMKAFRMCPECREEYENPESRRFHAQPISCNECGPKYELLGGRGKKYANAVEKAGELLARGKIIAVKGIGGFHLVCNAKNEEAVAGLRRAKHRKTKPFALMARDLETAKRIAHVSKNEIGILTSPERPIVILESNGKLESISPNLDSIGIMLPYAPIHHLLFRHSRLPLLVMTSANEAGEPLIIENKKALGLKVADFVLAHNRGIAAGCDDSVVKEVAGRTSILRYSRGMAPESIEVGVGGEAIGLGAELNANFCIIRGGRAYVSQYQGDLDDYAAYENYEKNIARYARMLKIDLKKTPIACDLHPDFETTALAEKISKNPVRVQHHFAHLHACMAENGLSDGIGIILDGYGYGSDGSAWGGEVLVSDEKRIGHIEEFELIGGDLAAREPGRILYAILRKKMSAGECERVFSKRFGIDARIWEKQLAKKINCATTTSCGRVLDAASFLFAGCRERTYEGEPAMRLEAIAADKEGRKGFEAGIREENGTCVLDVSEFFVELLGEKNARVGAGKVHDYLAGGFVRIAGEAAKERGLKGACLSGGVMYNRRIPRRIEDELAGIGLAAYFHRRLPCGDGCVSFGQAVLALKR